MRTISKLTAVAAAAAAVIAAAAPVSAQETASSISVLDEGHVDVFGIAYEEGELDLHIHDEETDTEYAPSEAILAANPEAKTTVPNDPAYSFLGEPGADDVWILPDTEQAGLLFAGWATEEIAPGDFVDDQLTLTVHDTWGPDEVALYTRDSFGSPNVLFDSDTGAGSWDVGAASHGHMNWAFGDSGFYRITVEAEGVLAETGEAVSTGEVCYWFWVKE